MADSEIGVKNTSGESASGEGVKDGEGVKPCVFKKSARRGVTRKRKMEQSSEGINIIHTHTHTHTHTHAHTAIDDSSDEESAVVRKEKRAIRGKLFQKTNTGRSRNKPSGVCVCGSVCLTERERKECVCVSLFLSLRRRGRNKVWVCLRMIER